MMAQERAAALRAEAEAKRRALGPEIAEAEELIRRWNRRVACGGWSHGERAGGGTNCGLAMATRVTENTK